MDRTEESGEEDQCAAHCGAERHGSRSRPSGKTFDSVRESGNGRVWDVAYALSLAFLFLASIGVTVVVIQRHKLLIRSDGKYYYIWARSILLDGDIDFRDDYSIVYESGELPRSESAVRTPRGYVVDKYPIGMAILEAPGFLIGDFVARHVVHSPTD